MICFYHADNDGKCAGFWVNKCGLIDKHGKAFFKIDYGIDFPFEKIHENEIVYIVWSSKVLQNNKALLSTTLPDGCYYEVTYNGDKDEMYIDVYKKWENICVHDVAAGLDKE